jgi:hypothetical protein
MAKKKNDMPNLGDENSTGDFDVTEDLALISAAVDVIEDKTDPHKRPEMHDHEWTDYILDQMQSDEIFDGKPKVNGLRRMILKELGPITFNDLQVLETPSEGNGYLVVCKYTVDIKFGAGDVRRFVGLADASQYNISPDFVKFTTATAETRAKGRAYRDALALSCVAAEEMNDKAAVQIDFNTDRISEQQLDGIDVMCKKLDINAARFIKENQSVFGYDRILNIKKDTAIQLLSKLTDYQRNVNTISDSLRGYKSGWRG